MILRTMIGNGAIGEAKKCPTKKTTGYQKATQFLDNPHAWQHGSYH
ncbi:hypothetical protein Hanom_Chr08g00686111 [Helianthus anomalus]